MKKTTWQATWQEPSIYPGLDRNITADVVIVGGGITGITLAYLLSRADVKVVVIEKGSLADASITAYTTAFLTYEIDTRFQDLKRMFGAQGAGAAWRSGEDALHMIQELIDEESIECEFTRCPLYLFGRTKKQWESLSDEARHAHKAGFPIEVKNIRNMVPFPHMGCAVLPKQAKFHPLQYAHGVRNAAEKYGAVFFENTTAEKITGNQPAVLHTSGGTVTAPWVVVTTYEPFHKPFELFAKKGVYVSYVVELSIPHGALAEGLYIDGDNPYHYFRVDRGMDTDRLILGGEDHRREVKIKPEKIYTALYEYADSIIGKHSYKKVTRWSGEIIETLDGLPLIGSYSKNHPNRLVATGFSGNGMTYSMTAASILRDQILGQSNPYAPLYDPRRSYSFTGLQIKGRQYVDEFIHGALKNIFKK